MMTVNGRMATAMPGSGAAIAPAKPQLIARCPLFQNLPEKVWRDLARRSLDVTFPASAVLFQAGEPADVAYLLVDGWVKMSAPGSTKHAIIAGPGDLSCWTAVLTRSIHASTAKAVGAVRVLALEKSDLEALLQRVPEVAQNAVHLLAGCVCEQQEDYLESASQQASQRLARVLLRLSHRRGNKPLMMTDVPLSRADLAEITGLSLFTVSRLLSLWDRKCLVKARRGRVKVEDPVALSRIADAAASPVPRKGRIPGSSFHIRSTSVGL